MFGKNEVRSPVWMQKAEPSVALGNDLIVHSIFPTIQGEGPFAGQPAIFVRLTGCNLRCYFCDTEFEKEANLMSVSSLISSIQGAMADCHTKLIVLTGGEPMRQQIIPFLLACRDRDWHVQIETAGTLWPPDAEVPTNPPPSAGPSSRLYTKSVSLDHLIGNEHVSLVCSPKTPKLHPKVIDWCQHYKYIIRHGDTSPADGLPMMSTQRSDRRSPVFRPEFSARQGPVTIWVQPMAEYWKPRSPDELPLPHGEATLSNMRECAAIAMRKGYRLSIQVHKVVGLE